MVFSDFCSFFDFVYVLCVLLAPIDPQLARQADLGVIESFEGDMLDGAADAIEKLL